MEKPAIKPTACVDAGERRQLVTWGGEKRQRRQRRQRDQRDQMDQRDQRGQTDQSDQAAEGSPVCDRQTLSLINQAQ